MIRVRALGQSTIQIDDVRVGPDAEIVFAAILLLAVQPGRRISRAELLGILWPNVPSSRASHCLRQTIYRLRTLGAQLEVDRTHVSLTAGVVDSDVDALLRATRTDDMERFADCVGGAFLPGYAPGFSEPLRDWVERQRDLTTTAARRVLVGAITARKARAEWPHVERLAHRCLEIDPLNEDATLALAEAAALHGAKREALRILDGYLREMGPSARELRVPAMALRRRIAEPEREFPLPPPQHVPFVGRSEEMAVLGSALRSARGGVGGVHFIHGEPGIGKTRLLTEFTRAAALEGVRIAPALCQSSDTRRPLSAFVDVVPKLMLMPGALGCSPSSHTYLRRLVEHHSSDTPPTPDTSEAVLLYANVRRSLFDLFDAIASESVLIVTIEDVHWLDAASWEIIAEAVAWIQTRRMMLVITSRDPTPQYPSTTRALPDSPRLVRLGPIDRGARAALLNATLRESAHAVSDGFRNWCVEMSGGNPYYLSELALHGHGSCGDFAIPPSLATLVAQRVARLQPTSCRVLQACAILGKNATLARLERVLDQPRLLLLDSLDELEHHGLVERDDAEIISRHDLLAQAAIAQMSMLSQRLLHRHTALALEADLVDDLSLSLAWSCIEHWARAGALERGVRIARRCARQAIELGRPSDAIELLEHAKSLPVSQSDRVEVITELLYAFRAADRWHDAVAEYAELSSLRLATADCTQLHDDTELTGIFAQWLGGVAIDGILRQIVDCCRSKSAAMRHRISAARLGLIICHNLRDASAAHEIISLIGPDLMEERIDVADRLDCRLIFETAFGDRDTAKNILDRLVSAAETAPARERAMYLIHAAHACERLGLNDRIEQLALLAYRLSEQSSAGTEACSAARNLAWHYIDRGQVDSAQHWHDVAQTWLEKGQFSSFRADIYGIEAEIQISRGHYDAAEKALQACPSAWSNTVHPRWQLCVLSGFLRVWIATDRRAAAESAVNEYRDLLMSVWHEEGNDILVARYYALLSYLGHQDEAEAALERYVATRRKTRENYSAELTILLASHSAVRGGHESSA
ncbi:MAG: ATP-binding protein [Gemmatimonadaceae bacterium]